MRAHVEFEFTGVSPALYALMVGAFHSDQADPCSIVW